MYYSNPSINVAHGSKKKGYINRGITVYDMLYIFFVIEFVINKKFTSNILIKCSKSTFC